MSTTAIVTLIIRYGLVMLFLPFSALDKVVGFEGAVKQAREVFTHRGLAVLVLLCGLGIEVVGLDAFVTGVADRLGDAANALRRQQNGFVRSYALSMVTGALVVLGALLAVTLA